MYTKIIISGEEARKKILSGVKKLGALVSATLGPAGRNVIIYKKYKPPLISNDGVTIARHTVLEDEVEDLGAQTVVEAALKTNEQAGDGTTTSVVIAVATIEKCMSQIENTVFGAKTNVMELLRKINVSKEKVIARLKEKAKPVGEGDLEKIIVTALENKEFGKTIAEMITQVGKDGYISVEDNWATQYGITTETTIGMKFYGTYVTPYMITNARKEAVWTNTPILITSGHLETPEVFKTIIEELRKQGKLKIVIIAEGFTRPMIESMARAIQIASSGNTQAMQVLAIKAPSLVPDQFRDIATYVKADFLDQTAGSMLQNTKIHQLGYAEKVVVNEDEVIITGGAGDTTKRIEELQEQIEIEKDAMFKEKLKRRIAALSSGIGIIRVGAMTESERGYLKYKIEDAVNAGKAAIEEGTIKGGGLALLEIAEELGEDDILYEAMKSPYEKIQENAGGLLAIGENILDPVKVTRLAVENACSAAGILITTESAIAEKPKSLWDELEKKLAVKDNHDFRADENQDLGIGKIV